MRAKKGITRGRLGGKKDHSKRSEHNGETCLHANKVSHYNPKRFKQRGNTKDRRTRKKYRIREKSRKTGWGGIESG